jgi:hypothetical protein
MVIACGSAWRGAIATEIKPYGITQYMYASACHENAEIRDRFPIYRGPFASGALIHHLLALTRRHATMYTLCVEAPGWESCAGKQPGRHTKARLPAPSASSAAEQKTPVAELLKPTQSLPLKGVRDRTQSLPLKGVGIILLQADGEASPGWAGASWLFGTAIWPILAHCCAAQEPVICEASRRVEVCFDAAASSLAVRQWTTAADWADSVPGSLVRACGFRLCSDRCAWDAGRRFLSCGG